MDAPCPLCDRLTPGEQFELPSSILGSDPAAPMPICPACAALSPEERRTLRDRAMQRMLLNRDDD